MVVPALLSLLVQAASAEQSDLGTDVEALLETFHETYGFPGATVTYVTAD
ncbi:hypothetical protein GTF97_12355 [Roseobacter sp. HKCCD8767]|nr:MULTISPECIES: hypothetical protein [unclassified Roseobacter]NNV30215.1 hypothetical protein [Roseobacter sp. HKCCD9061]NNV68527.1 hypothetical protein [Roseobacter sp. HKCCD8474]NNV93564.1 hypothetical protein [Roseobacter sp. HKCCD8914]NNW19629.1 hypothetical protein [Roseobacter sp. HKCCD7543]NNW40420.1 hypothetical protein [Roseobacter sp. HKCCD8654]NNW61765.1 hypothetical protein [Roseobacter sp. HKCCD8268]NNW79326.1 hypothetical protein [Roseobacter sp. HKCCD8134]NNW87843.1 hypothe